jgi:hypothetical protein
MSLSYVDDEGDEITVATDADLAEAFVVTQWPEGRPSLHFSVRANDTPYDLNVETEVKREVALEMGALQLRHREEHTENVLRNKLPRSRLVYSVARKFV